MASTDRAALLALFRSTRGSGWKNSNNWNTTAPLSEWYGVDVDGEGRVVKLLLNDNNLQGTIPRELGTLATLQKLNLSKNGLTGSIPKELGALVELQELSLRDNKLTGAIPQELGRLAKLRILYLTGNGLTGSIPKELGGLVKLDDLRLSDNELVGAMPNELGKLVTLRILELNGNGLTGSIPKELGGLDKLEVLRLALNKLTGVIPTELGRLKALRRLYLDGNGLTGAIPQELGRLVKLRILYLDGNGLTGSIPKELGGLIKLEDLRLRDNELMGEIPTELGRLVTLRILLLSGNGLTGSIPKELGGLDKVEDLQLDLNKLTGAIPTELGRLKTLRKLYLHGNGLTGSIPEALGGLVNLEHLWLNDNNLSGPIPGELGDLVKLEVLNFEDNKLRGSIPKELGGLVRLEDLRLSDNELIGAMPKELGRLVTLRILELNGNGLTGSIPKQLGGLDKLEALRLDLNKLTGVIPTELGRLVTLRKLYLHGNGLTGSIPEALGGLVHLEQLWLNDNNLTGSIPGELGDLVKLEELHLQDNKLTGSIPEDLGHLVKLKALLLDGNKLTGAVPAELGNLSALSNFQLGNTGSKFIFRRGNKVTGGPAKGESLGSWKARLRREQERKLHGDQKEANVPVPPPSLPPVVPSQQQETGEGDDNEENAPVAVLGSPTQREATAGEQAVSQERASSFPEQAGMDRLFRAQLLSSAGVDSLVRQHPKAMEDIQRVLEAQVAGSFSPDHERGDMERRRKLGTLITMSTALGEVVLKHTEDMDERRKELALPAFSRSYYTTVRGGLSQAYLAASVIGSDWVATNKTGVMGKAGAALKVLSSAVPVVGGLPKLAGKALETGDHYLHSRRLAKIAAMAPDTMEFCSLARKLALRLTDGLEDSTGATADDVDQVHLHTMAGMKGGFGSGRGADVTPGDMSEEDVFEYLLEEVASYERNDHGGKRLGKKHLRKLLKAIQRGCLDGSGGTEEKIEILLLEILPEAGDRPAAKSSTPKEVIVRSPPVVAPAHDGGLPSRADFAALQATVEALKFDRERQQAELEELQAAKDEQQEELKAMGSANEKLQRKMSAMEKRVPEGDCEPGDMVNAGGQVLQKKLETKEDLKTFWHRKENEAGARGQGTLTPAEHQAETRETRVRVDDVDNRVDYVEAQVAALAQQQAGKKWWEF